MSFTSLLMILPIPIVQFFPIFTPCLMIAPLPIKVLSFTITCPLRITLVDIWQLFPIFTPCSTTADVLIMVFWPIWAPKLTIALWCIIVPSSIIAFLETYAAGDIIIGNLNFFLNSWNILILFFGDLIKPKLICKLIFFFLPFLSISHLQELYN